VTEGASTSSYPHRPQRVKRLHERGFYDHETVHKILDASMMCHVSLRDRRPAYCTPTFFWREGTKSTGHGKLAPAVPLEPGGGRRVCLTVAHLDSLVLARCGSNHSAVTAR